MTGGQSAVRMNDRHSFPVGGLVELSRATYQSTPLAVVEIRPTVFSFIGAGGTVTAVGADVSGPRVSHQRVNRIRMDYVNLFVHALSVECREMPHQSRNILSALPQGGDLYNNL
jgi:hypothetical protein